MNRRLVVPLAFERAGREAGGRTRKPRTLRESCEDGEDLEILKKLAENRMRLARLQEDIERDPEVIDDDDIANELDYLKATIQLGLLEVTGELEEIPTSEEVFEEAVA
ncbi:MAG: hypothetical protein ACUVT7_06160 [Thermoplasmata archaeon]